MRKLADREIEGLYAEIKTIWEKNLESKGIKIPNLRRGDNYTKYALVLIKLYQNYKKVVSKSDLTDFVKLYYPGINDVQQGRHLAAQKGWYIISKTRGDILSEKYKLQEGDYLLHSLDEPYPNFTEERRSLEMEDETWESLKKFYDYRCATCGSVEGEPNIHYPSTITKLQMGHMDPNKPLVLKNTIPQCDKCNRPDRNYFVYNKKGRVIKIADPKFVLKSDVKVQKEIYELLKKKFDQ